MCEGKTLGEHAMQTQRVRIIEGGKLVIPAAMRRELGIATGDTVLVDVAEGELRVRSLSTRPSSGLKPSCAGTCPRACRSPTSSSRTVGARRSVSEPEGRGGAEEDRPDRAGERREGRGVVLDSSALLAC
jgi:AbrB family looped-hinge helix DNA binding protein